MVLRISLISQALYPYTSFLQKGGDARDKKPDGGLNRVLVVAQIFESFLKIVELIIGMVG